MSVKRLLIFAVAVIALFVFAYRNIIPGQFALVDIIPWSKFASQYYFANFLSSWGKTALGTAQAAPPSFIFLAIFTYLFKNNIGLGHQIFYLSLLPLSGITMYIFLNEFIDSEIAKYVGALFYAINPLSMGQFAGGAGYIIVYPVLPLLAFWFSRLLREGKERRLRNTLMFSFFLALGAAFNSFLPFVIMPILGAYLLVWGLKNRNVKDIANILLFTALSFVIVILLMLPNYYALIFSSLNKPLSQVAAEGASEISMQGFIPQIRYTYAQATPLHLLRMLHGVWFGASTFWNLFSLIIPVLAFIPLILIERKKSLFIFGSYILVVSVILFIWLTHLDLTIKVFELIPVLFIYRNPVPLVTLLPLAYASLIAITATKILSGFVAAQENSRALTILNSPTIRLAAISFIIIVISIYSWPFFTGDLGLSKAIGRDYIVPRVYYKMADWIEKNRPKTPFRVIILPWDYNTKLRASIIDMMPDVTVLPVPTRLLSTLSTGQADGIETVLGPMSAKYMIVNLDSPDGRVYSNLLNEQKALKKVRAQDGFAVYENLRFVPELAVFDRLYLALTPEDPSERFVQFLASAPFFAPASGDSLERIPQFLARTPRFDPTKALLAYEKGSLSPKNPWLDKANLVIIPSDALASAGDLSGYRGEILILYTNVNKHGVGDYTLYVPRSGLYKIAVRMSSGGRVSMTINDRDVSMAAINDDGKGRGSWHESEAITLNNLSGYRLSSVPEKGTIVDEVAVFSSDRPDTALGDLFDKTNRKSGFLWKKPSPTKYEANLASDEPLFIVLGQSFDPRWEASLDGEKLEHFTAFGWANGFYIDAKGRKTLKISYGEQKNRNIVLGVWILSWLLLVGGVIYTYGISSLKKFNVRQRG